MSMALAVNCGFCRLLHQNRVFDVSSFAIRNSAGGDTSRDQEFANGTGCES